VRCRSWPALVPKAARRDEPKELAYRVQLHAPLHTSNAKAARSVLTNFGLEIPTLAATLGGKKGNLNQHFWPLALS
jgi:hypothetical protein